MENAPSQRIHVIQQVFEDVGHIHFRLPLHKLILNAANWVFGRIKSHVQQKYHQNYRTLLSHINDDV